MNFRPVAFVLPSVLASALLLQAAGPLTENSPSRYRRTRQGFRVQVTDGSV